jgi:acyl carrier protein
MTVRLLTEQEVHELLVGVGVSPAVVADSLDRTFEELELDSLARIQIASQIKDRFGVDVEEELSAKVTPGGMRELVNRRLAGLESGGVR